MVGDVARCYGALLPQMDDTMNRKDLAPEAFNLVEANAAILGRTMVRGRTCPCTCYPAANHQPGFAAHTVSPDGHRALRDGTLAMAWTIIDMAEQNQWSIA